MSNNYDNWERLIAAVLDREHLRQLAREPSSSSISYSSISQPPTPIHNDPNFQLDKSLLEFDMDMSSSRSFAQKTFLIATSLAAERVFFSPDSILQPDEAFSKFLTMYPEYQTSEKIDQLRLDEYSHLSNQRSKVCLDYCGFGLFSFLQTVDHCQSSAFALSEITANLCNHALYGGDKIGTIEHDIRTRIMDYLNIPENEYCLVFTSSHGSAFKLVAESYPFETNKRLLALFDHESQSVNWMAQSAREKGAKVYSAWFKWPNLKLCSTDLRKQLSTKKGRKKDSAAGLFVFPVQSRVTGAKYSYQWMTLAQQNNWHVLLDAGALGPNDMDSLGLSLFRPDFIIASFYRVFGYDPTGFGCLLIKKSVIESLKSQSGSGGSGLVKITHDVAAFDEDGVKIVCRHLDHISMLGLKRTKSRLRFLVTWLVTSFLQLRLPASNEISSQLVHIYGPKVWYERGAAVAFNVRDKDGGMISPETVQKLAESQSISLGVGILSHIRLDSSKENRESLGILGNDLWRPIENGRRDSRSEFIRIEVVTASLGFLTSFDDVYKLWAFVARFLDPSFVKESS